MRHDPCATQVQHASRLCIQRDLTEHDVVSRIMRRDNYLIGMLNKVRGDLCGLARPGCAGKAGRGAGGEGGTQTPCQAHTGRGRRTALLSASPGFLLEPTLQIIETPAIPQGVLPLHVPVPGLRRHTMLTKTLEWSLQRCVFNHMFDAATFRVRPEFVGRPELLRRRFLSEAVLMLALSPFVLLFLLIYFFMRNAEKFYNHPASLGARRWSLLAKCVPPFLLPRGVGWWLGG